MYVNGKTPATASAGGVGWPGKDGWNKPPQPFFGVEDAKKRGYALVLHEYWAVEEDAIENRSSTT